MVEPVENILELTLTKSHLAARVMRTRYIGWQRAEKNELDEICLVEEYVMWMFLLFVEEKEKEIERSRERKRRRE